MDDTTWRKLIGRFDTYLTAERGLAPLTRRNYTTDIEPLFEFMRREAIADLGDLDRYTIRAYLAWLVELGYVKASVVRKLSALRTFIRWLIRIGVLTEDPLPTRGMMKKESRLPRFLSQNEAARLVSAPDGSDELKLRDRALLEVIYAAGLRVSEVRDLNVNDINFETKELRVRGKGSKQRVVLIGEAAHRALYRYLHEVRPTLVTRESARGVSEPQRREAEPAQHSGESPQVLDNDRTEDGCAYAHPSPLVRDAPARGRRGPASRAGTAGSRIPRDNADIHARDADTGPQGVPCGTPPCSQVGATREQSA